MESDTVYMAEVIRSFRLKTVLLTVLLSSVLLFSTGFFGWRWLLSEFEDALDARIVLPGQRITEYHGWNSDWDQFATTVDTLIGDEWKEDRILKLRSNMFKRGTVYQSENWPDEFPQQDIPNLMSLMEEVPMGNWNETSSFVRYPLLDQPHLYTVIYEGEAWRMASLANPELTLYIGISLDDYQARIRQLRLVYFGALVAVLVCIGAGAYWICSRALSPVDAIAHTARRTSSKDLSQRIEESRGYDQEFDVLISVINEMMDRLETSFHQALRFSSDASHELKTPLAIIQTEISSRLQQCESGSGEQETLSRLLLQVDRLKRIIRSLFLLSQADAGKMPLSREVYDLSAQVESFYHDAQILAEGAKLTIEATAEPGIYVEADKLMLGQVLQNLISNAVKHNEPGGRIRWNLRREEGWAVFEIENTGPTISGEEQAQVFGRFFRGSESHTRDAGGLGLGLSLAKELVLAHEGQLELVSSEEGLTKFRLRLRWADESE